MSWSFAGKVGVSSLISIILWTVIVWVAPPAAAAISNLSLAQTPQYLFVANQAGGKIYVFNNADTPTLKTTLTIGNGPSHLVLYKSNYLLVALSQTTKIAVIDLASLTVKGYITTPKMPYQLGVDGARLWVTVAGNNGAHYEPFVLEQLGDDILSWTPGSPAWGTVKFWYGNEHILIDSAGRRAYFGNIGYSPDNISKYNITATATPAWLLQNEHGSLGSNGQHFVLSEDGSRIYLATGSGGTGYGYSLQVVKTADLTKESDLTTGSYPNAVAIDSAYIYAGKDAYYDPGDVKVFSRADNILVREYSFDSGETLVARALSAGARVYAATDKYLYLLSSTDSTATKFYDLVNEQVFTPPPPCTIDTWECGDWGLCSAAGAQTRSCRLIFDCKEVNTPSPSTTQSCLPPPPACAADIWVCSNWGLCSAAGLEIRSCTRNFDCPSAVTPSPPTSQSCSPSCQADTWTCEAWSQCAANNLQTRTCTKTLDCPTTETAPPPTSQTCTPSLTPAPPGSTPACTTDTWTCEDWGACGPNGLQTRSCRKADDCAAVETAPPPTSQNCVPPSPVELTDQLLRATVKLICETATIRSQGSGTIIDAAGTILTNRHVLEAEQGKTAPTCYVGFTTDPDQEPDFSEAAAPRRVATDEDVALLSITSPTRSSYPTIDFSAAGDSKKLKFGNKLQVLGFPGVGGAKLTYSSGDFSGFGSRQNNLGNYLKTTAVIEQGNSGGGAYTQGGAFIGIPTLAVTGKISSIGYLLAVNKIKNWLETGSTGGAVKSSLPAGGATISLKELREQLKSNADLQPPEVGAARIKSQITKRNQLVFSVFGVTDRENKIAGYYMYFGADARANPVARGKFSSKPQLTVRRPSKAGTYYFIFVAKDSHKNLSEPYIFEYRFRPRQK